MQQKARSLDMAEEAVANAGAFGGALDQAGNVGEHEFAALVANDPELGAERGERVIADLGTCVADRVEERRLAGVWQADEADVGEQFEAQPDPGLLTGLASLVLARRAVGRGLVTGVAAPAHAAFEEADALAGAGQVGEQGPLLIVGEDLGADRDFHD